MSEQKQSAKPLKFGKASQKVPSVMTFEKAVSEKNYEAACVELLDILRKIDSNFGGIHDIECDFPEQLNVDELNKKSIFILQRVWQMLLPSYLKTLLYPYLSQVRKLSSRFSVGYP